MNYKDCTLGFLLGIGAGVAVGLLFAPQSGVKARHFLSAKTQEGVDNIREAASDLRDSANSLVDDGLAEVARKQAGLKNAVAAGQKAYRATA